MVLLLLGDSQVERVWPTVRLDREVLRDAIFVPVKNRQAIMSGYQSITAAVSVLILFSLIWGFVYFCISLYSDLTPFIRSFSICIFPVSVYLKEDV